jgi:chromodomain-helicase-DNA-binding protein 7
MEPEEWKLVHENLYNRTDLNDEELRSLFVTIAAFGLPMAHEGFDWQLIKQRSKLTCVSIEAVASAGEAIASFARDEDGTTNGLTARLGTYGGRQWHRKLRNSIRDIEKVRSFMGTFTKADEELLSKVKRFDASDWWTALHDLALLSVISEFGQLVVTTWVVDPGRPFRDHIPSDLLDDFEKAAETEKLKGRQCKPKEMGDLAFLFKDKLRISRALLVIKFVEGNRSQPPKSLPVLKMPFQLSVLTTIISLGQFPSRDSRYPVGYMVHTCYLSPFNLHEHVWYEGTIGFGDIFTVKMLCEPFLIFQGIGCQAPWEQILARAQRLMDPAHRLNLMPAPDGHLLFGLNHPVVANTLQRLRQIAPYAPMPVPLIAGLQPYQFQPVQQAVVPPQRPVEEPGQPQRIVPIPEFQLTAIMAEPSGAPKPATLVVRRKFPHDNS